MPTGSYPLSHPASQADTRLSTTAVAAGPQHELLLLLNEPLAAEYAAALRKTYRVATTVNPDVAMQYLHKTVPSLVTIDADVAGSAAVPLCRAAKAPQVPSTVLITGSEVKAVPHLLECGCDAVLLKPFAPNLLYARIGRLLRGRSEQVRVRAGQEHMRFPYAASLPETPLATTNRTWPDTACPSCGREGAVSFEFSSHRRAWYACLACKNVWIAKRQE